MRRPPPGWTGSLTGSMLGAAVIGLTGWAVLEGGWVDGAGASLVVGIGGLLEAVLLARLGISRVSAAAAVPLLLVATVIPLTLRIMPTDGDASVMHAASRYLDAVTGGFFANSDWQFVVALCSTLWITGFWLGWCALRERRGVVATLPCYTVLAVNALNAPSLAQVVVPETLAAGACVLVVMESHFSRLSQGWGERLLTIAPGMRARFVRSGLLATTAVVGLAAVVPPATTRDISSSIFAARVHPPEPADSPSVAGSPPTVAFSPDTRPAGPITSEPRPAITYRTDAPSTAYLRLVNDTVFDAGAWLPDLPGGSGNPVSKAAVAIVAAPEGPLPRDRELAHGGVGSTQSTVHTTVAAVGVPARDLPVAAFAGEAESTAGAGPVHAAGLAYPPAASLLTVDQVAVARPPVVGHELATTSTVSVATESQLRLAGTGYPAFTAGLRSLVDDGSGQAGVIRALAQEWTAGISDPYDQARSIEAHLRDPQRFTYDLSPPLPPAGAWPILTFLTTTHRGYCQYFASSMGAMVRSLGIPARLVSGYGPGTVAPAEEPGMSVHTVTTSDAHTWVEVYFPRYGWIPFEPTPPSTLGDYRPLPRGPAAAAAPSPKPASAGTPTPAPVPPPSPSPSPPPPSRPAPSPARSSAPVALAVTGAAATGLPLSLLWWWMRPRSLGALWLRLGCLGRLLGVRRRRWETDHAYAGRLAAGLAGIRASSPEALLRIADVSGAARFSAAGLPSTARPLWMGWWREVVATTPRVLGRWLRHRFRRRVGSVADPASVRRE